MNYIVTNGEVYFSPVNIDDFNELFSKEIFKTTDLQSHIIKKIIIDLKDVSYEKNEIFYQLHKIVKEAAHLKIEVTFTNIPQDIEELLFTLIITDES